MPVNYKLYSPVWHSEIRPSILERAGHCCERCRVPDRALVLRDPDGNWYTDAQVMNMDISKFDGEFSRIRLQVAHVNQDITDNRPENLLALCPRCHFSLDLPYNLPKRRETWRRKRIARHENRMREIGQPRLFPEDSDL